MYAVFFDAAVGGPGAIAVVVAVLLDLGIVVGVLRDQQNFFQDLCEELKL